MVERPIKKSERQSPVSTDDSSGNSDSMPSVESSPRPSNESIPKPTKRLDKNDLSEKSDDRRNEKTNDRSQKSNDRSSGKGKRASIGDDSRQMGNPALARGPKPVKIQAPVPKQETESESLTQEPSEETAQT